MSYQTIELRKSAPSIGAEIFGVDLSKPLGNQQFQEVHDALMDRLVIFFRDQKLSVEQHMDFGRRFGKLHRHPASPDVLPDHPEVLVIKVDDKAKYIPGEDWHSDVSCDPEPPMGSILYLTGVPPDGGGDTMFANMSLETGACSLTDLTPAIYFDAPPLTSIASSVAQSQSSYRFNCRPSSNW
jgi:taurine dioxygenase